MFIYKMIIILGFSIKEAKSGILKSERTKIDDGIQN